MGVIFLNQMIYHYVPVLSKVSMMMTIHHVSQDEVQENVYLDEPLFWTLGYSMDMRTDEFGREPFDCVSEGRP